MLKNPSSTSKCNTRKVHLPHEEVRTTKHYKTGTDTSRTLGEQGWTCTAGSKAPQAAGKIHTDFEKGFIRAEVIQWDKLLEANGYVGAKEKGWLRVERKEYVVQDEDIVHFLFNV